MKITDNMVELAAMALANADREAGKLDRWEHPPTPESASEAWRDMHRRRARTALTAALADLTTLADPFETAATNKHGRQARIIELGDTMSTKAPMRIIIAQRGWVFAGRYEMVGDEVVLSDAVVIRRWGTSRGLGELAQTGPTARTVLDPAGTVHIHRLAVVAEFEVAEGTTWRP